MVWQDIVLGFVQAGFSLALVPSIVHGPRPNWGTCLLTGAGLAVVSFCVATLGLWFASFCAGLCGTLWFYMLGQEIAGLRKPKYTYRRSHGIRRIDWE
jgi:hypothetical protein